MIKLNDDKVHIYSLEISAYKEAALKLLSKLPEAEKLKIAKYKFQKDQINAVTTFYLRRLIISNYTGLNLDEIIIDYSQYGKPYLSNSDFKEIKFNYSHSKGQFVFVTTKNSEIGVDIELKKNFSEIAQVAKRNFSESEFKLFMNTESEAERINSFYKIWTRKEALLKAIGTGILPELKNFSVIDEYEKEVSSCTMLIDKNSWIICDLDSPENYVSSVAYQSENKFELIYFDTI